MNASVFPSPRHMMVLVCLIAGTCFGSSGAIAQNDAGVDVISDSIAYMPLKRYDFGTPIPNPTRSVNPEDVISETPYARVFSEPSLRIRTMSTSEDSTEYAVGEIPYQESVTPTGGRTYVVPIMTAPQLKSAPQVSLQYNSHGGNGLAGYGWEIGGISSIRLIHKNLYYHGAVAPATILDGDGAYSLDGITLVQNDDPALATEYPLETAQGHILVKKFVSIDLTTHFQVLYPDGSRATFGSPSEASRKFVFPITSWEDRYGNRVTYNYTWDGDEYYIQSVQYGHKDNEHHIGKINFFYSDRTDYVDRYYAGKLCSRKKILDQITTSCDEDLLCKYTLDYEFREGVNQLIQLGCENSEGESLPPLCFSYGSETGPDDGYGDASGSNPHDLVNEDRLFLTDYFAPSEEVGFIYSRGKFISGSYSDGLIILPYFPTYDIVAVKQSGALWWKEYHYQYGSTYSADQAVVVVPRWGYISDSDVSITVGSGFQCINAADVDGDGVDEIVKVNFNGTSSGSSTTMLKMTIYQCNPSTGQISEDRSFNVPVNGIVTDGDLVSPLERCYHFGDFVGNGRQQLLTVSYNSDRLNASRTSYASLIDLDTGIEQLESSFLSLSHEDVLFCVDINGDGKTEVCHSNHNAMDIYSVENNVFMLIESHSLSSQALSQYKYHITDLNGDGYIEIVTEPSADEGNNGSWVVYSYTGQHFTTIDLNLPGNVAGNENMFMDINNDGLQDLITKSGSSVVIYTNSNSTFRYEDRIVSSCIFAEGSQLVTCSVSGYDTSSDFITVEGAGVNIYRFSQDLSADRLLTRFTNSLGRTTLNAYENMESSIYVYDPYGTRTYDNEKGFAKSCFPLQLLYNERSFISSSDGNIDYLTNLYYRYSDACIHKQGLGFCGFGGIRTTDMMTDLDEELVTTEIRDPERMGVTTRLTRSHLLSQDTPYDVTEYTYDDHTTTYGKLNPRLKKIVRTDTLAALTSTTTYTYGAYDFPAIVTTSNVSGSHRSIESHIYQYDHKTAPDCYILGSILSDTKSLIDPVTEMEWTEKQEYTYNQKMLPLTQTGYIGDTSLHKTGESRWTYDDSGNVLTETHAPFDVTEFIGKSYVYDDYGVNLLSVTDELGHTTTFSEYDKFGNPHNSTDYRGRITTDIYDDWGNHISRSYPDRTGFAVIRSWGGLASYTMTTRTVGKPEQIVHYDAAGREVRNGTQRFNGQWIFTDTSYGRNGQVSKVSLPFKSGTEASLWNTYEYDEYMRPTSFTQASGNVTIWEYDGRRTIETKNGIWSAKIRDSSGNVIRVEDEGGTIEYTLRLDGQPTGISVTGGGVTLFEYDKYGRRIRITDPSAGVQTDTTSYNPDGSSVSVHTNPNGSIITHVDRYGRTTKVERPGEYTTDYVYDSHGRLESETSSNGTSKIYAYDNFNRLHIIEERVPDGKFLRKTYVYTTDGNLAKVTYASQSGGIGNETYAYSNGTNTAVAFNNTYVRGTRSENEFGQPTSVITGGILRQYWYDRYGMPVRRTMGNVMDCTYQFEHQTGNLLYRQDNLRNRRENFGYDQLNRLDYIDYQPIIYSENGNILVRDGAGEYQYGNASKPYQVTAFYPEADVQPSAAQAISYTCYSRPSIITEGGKSAAFTYNGDGARVKMNLAEGTSSLLTRYYIADRYELDVTSAGTTERLYLGGDAYSAPMVAIKNGSGAWTLYNIGRDYLGNITHIATSDGTLVEENSYDPWGRLRDPQTYEAYSPGNEPQLMLGRGYTGHEHLTQFGLINMNARLYDPVLGRFLSPDPFVQMPDFTQNFNRYSYCLNNPLVYVDENGEIFFTTAVIIGLCVGTALGAGLGVYKGYKIAEDKGLEGSAKVWTMIGGGLIGGLAGGASAIVGAYVGSTIAVGGFIGGVYTGGAAGATAGFINGFGMSTLETGNPLFGLKQGVVQAFWGGLSGALVGGTIQGISAYSQGNKFLDGSSNLSHGGSSSNIPEYDLNPDPTGGNETLYRGTTGSENYYGELYMTDNYEYASSYVKNGGNVAKIQIPKSTLELMKYNSDLCIKRGINASWSNVSYNEYVFSPQVKASIVIRFKF